jgi:type IV fimbrial biogenesis protein FimT
MIARNSNRAFTLIELVIALAIMAILMTIALPNFQTFMVQRRLNGAAREVYGDLASARGQAVSMNKWVALNIDSNHAYTLFHDDNKNGAVDTGETIATKDLHPTYHDVLFSTATGTVITFYPNGTGSTGTLGLTGGSGSKSITVSSNGRININ